MSASRQPAPVHDQFPDDVSHVQPITSGEGLLNQLRRGEIDAQAYIELRVARATEGLAGLGDEQLAFVKETLRHQIQEDPTLSRMLETVLAASPLRVA